MQNRSKRVRILVALLLKLFKGFDLRRRDTIFYAVLFIWPPSRAAPIGRKFASRLRAPKVDPSRLASNSQLLLSSNLTQTSARFRSVTSPAPCHHVSSRTIMTSEWHLHPPALTPASMLHLTNPCAEPKCNKTLNFVLIFIVKFITIFQWNRKNEIRKSEVRINFYLLRTFFPHLGSFCVFSSFTTFRPNFTSGLLRVIYRDLG